MTKNGVRHDKKNGVRQKTGSKRGHKNGVRHDTMTLRGPPLPRILISTSKCHSVMPDPVFVDPVFDLTPFLTPFFVDPVFFL